MNHSRTRRSGTQRHFGAVQAYLDRPGKRRMPRPAIVSDAKVVPYKRRVTGSNSVASTRKSTRPDLVSVDRLRDGRSPIRPRSRPGVRSLRHSAARTVTPPQPLVSLHDRTHQAPAGSGLLTIWRRCEEQGRLRTGCREDQLRLGTITPWSRSVPSESHWQLSLSLLLPR